MNLQEIIFKGAIIIDVRTKEEFAGQHLVGSLNIPVDEISKNMDWLQKDIPTIVVCASGSRSATAKLILDENGFKEVYNGGAWDSLGNIQVGKCPVK